MDRVIVYPGALPQTVDVLNANKFAMIAEAYQNLSILGSGTVVAGLAATPSTPTADLHVNVAVGTIFQIDPTDAAAYGDLGTDNTSIMKMGILQTPSVLTITPPATTGFSQVFLIQASLTDVDAGSTTLSYYNSSNPTQPFSGPSNSGTSNNTTRLCKCNIALKAGVAATTGTQTTPSADAGFVALYAVTVANGATQVVSGNIVKVSTAPFFPTLPSVPVNVLNGSWVYAGQDTGTANTYVITFAAGQPIPTSYVAGMGVKFKALNACSGASTVNVNGLGAVAIRRASGAAVATGDIVSGQMVELTYDGTNFQMQNYMGAGAGTNTTTIVSIPYVADSGTQNALVGTYSPAITGGQQVAGLALEIKLANTITGAATINVNGLGAKSIVLGDGTPPPFGVFTAGGILVIAYDGTNYQIVNTSSGMFYRRPTANIDIYVNGSTGNDTTLDGTSATVSGSRGPFATIGKGILSAFGFAPSQFTITIHVAAGTYNENVSTPSYGGPAIIIDGGTASGTIVSGGAGDAIRVSGPNKLTVTNVTVQCNLGPSICGFRAISGALMTTSNTISNTCGNVFVGEAGGSISPGTHTFNGSAFSLFSGINGGSCNLQQVTYTIGASIAVSTGTAFANANGVVTAFSGTPPSFANPTNVSGLKYYGNANGVINAQSLGFSLFPGSGGTLVLGGQYVS